MQHQIQTFFEAYEQRVNDALEGKPYDVNAAGDAFAEYFVESSPAGIIGGQNDDAFREKIPQGYDFYRKIGTTSMKIANIDILQIDDIHAMVKVHWISSYEGGKIIGFNVHYIVNIVNDIVKIFAYITGDEQKVLKENGLI